MKHRVGKTWSWPDKANLSAVASALCGAVRELEVLTYCKPIRPSAIALLPKEISRVVQSAIDLATDILYMGPPREIAGLTPEPRRRIEGRSLPSALQVLTVLCRELQVVRAQLRVSEMTATRIDGRVIYEAPEEPSAHGWQKALRNYLPRPDVLGQMMNDIEVEIAAWDRVLAAAPRSHGIKSKKKPRLEWMARAMMLKQKNPEWTDQVIAKMAGTSATRLSRCEEYQRLKEKVRSAGRRRATREDRRKNRRALPPPAEDNNEADR